MSTLTLFDHGQAQRTARTGSPRHQAGHGQRPDHPQPVRTGRATVTSPVGLAVAVLALVTLTVVLLLSTPASMVPSNRDEATILRAEKSTLLRRTATAATGRASEVELTELLQARGLIPVAHDPEAEATARLVARGLVPGETVDAG